MKPTLFLLAAGMGSRYGGLKQLDGLGPNGETIMDYSIYDAIQAGFGKLVFVIRKDFEQDFRTLRFFGVEVKGQRRITAVECSQFTVFIGKLNDITVGGFKHPENCVFVVTKKTVDGNRSLATITEHQLLIEPPIYLLRLFPVHLACA